MIASAKTSFGSPISLSLPHADAVRLVEAATHALLASRQKTDPEQAVLPTES